MKTIDKSIVHLFNFSHSQFIELIVLFNSDVTLSNPVKETIFMSSAHAVYISVENVTSQLFFDTVNCDLSLSFFFVFSILKS